MSLKQVSTALKKYKNFLITTHTNPDADALASCLAMSVFLRSKGKGARVVFAENVPAWLKFLPHGSSVKKYKRGERVKFDAAIVLDCGDIKRPGVVTELLKSPQAVLINIDHHVTNTNFGDYNWVAPGSSSTSEILFDLFQANSFIPTRAMAILLYAGIMTDTGSFRFENTSAHTHAVVALLMRQKFSVPEMYHRLYEGVPIQNLNDFVRILNQVQLLPGNRVAHVALREELIQQFSKRFDLRDKIFTFFRSFDGVEAIVIFTQLKNGQTRVNFRSQKILDVAQLAKQFGGGGHARASGCTLNEPLNSVRAKILSAIRKKLPWKA